MAKNKRKRESFAVIERKSKTGIPYTEWKKIPEEHVLTEEHIGKFVYVAGFRKTQKFILQQCHHKGEEFWPEFDGYSVYMARSGQRRMLKKECCRLHPCEYKKRRRRKFKF